MPEGLCCPTEVLLMAHGAGYLEDRGYHYLRKSGPKGKEVGGSAPEHKSRQVM